MDTPPVSEVPSNNEPLTDAPVLPTVIVPEVKKPVRKAVGTRRTVNRAATVGAERKKIMNLDAVTFLLKSIKHDDIYRRLKAGEFKEIKIIPLKPAVHTTVNITKNIFTKIYSNDVKDGVYIVEDSHGNKFVFATTGVSKVDNCRICHKDLTTVEVPYGIPIMLRYTFDKLEVAFHAPIFCSLEYSYAKFLNTVKQDDPFYANTKELYRMVHELKNRSTDKKFTRLKPANDWSLCSDNGGSLPREEWSNSEFIQTVNFTCVPFQKKFIKQ